jgi:hypothetical protein
MQGQLFICFAAYSPMKDVQNQHVNLNVNLPNGLRAAVGIQMYAQVDQQYAS